MQRACNEGWEGVIAKRLNFRYEHCQSPHPLKMKLRGVAGVGCRRIHGTTGRTDRPGCALVAYFEANELVFAGKVGTGFDTKLLVELRARLDAIEVPKSPFTKAIGLPRVRAHWVQPEIVVRVAFIEWTPHGKLRHSRFLGVRSDKPAREVARETS